MGKHGGSVGNSSGLLIIGAGGHGKVVADVAKACGQWRKIAFLDDRWPELREVCGFKVIGDVPALSAQRSEYAEVLVAVRDNALRMRLSAQAETSGYTAPVLVHPRAYVSDFAALNPGAVVLAQVAVNVDAGLGRGVIVNTGAVVEHDCRLGDGVHISPGAFLGGNVEISALSWGGIGAAVRDKTKVGAKVTVGAESVVVKDMPDDALVYGEAARIRNGLGAEKVAAPDVCDE